MPKPVELDLPMREITPDPQVEKRARRVFTTEYKLRRRPGIDLARSAFCPPLANCESQR